MNEGDRAADREFADASGRRWKVAYTGSGVRGLVTMEQIVFRAVDGEPEGEERYLAVHPGYLERIDEEGLQAALSQAQSVTPP